MEFSRRELAESDCWCEQSCCPVALRVEALSEPLIIESALLTIDRPRVTIGAGLAMPDGRNQPPMGRYPVPTFSCILDLVLSDFLFNRSVAMKTTN